MEVVAVVYQMTVLNVLTGCTIGYVTTLTTLTGCRTGYVATMTTPALAMPTAARTRMLSFIQTLEHLGSQRAYSHPEDLE